MGACVPPGRIASSQIGHAFGDPGCEAARGDEWALEGTDAAGDAALAVVVIAADSNASIIGVGVKPVADTIALHSVKSHSASPTHGEAQLPPRSNRGIAHESFALLAANRRKVAKHLA